MPWKAFMQSSALTNSGNQLANALFMQRENASCSLISSPKFFDSLFELICCHLETHFEVIQEKSAHVDPSTPCNCLQSMLYLCAVSGLVVSRMEAILEHGCFDIVTFLPFLKRDGFNFLANLGFVHLFFGEVPPSLLSIWTLNSNLPSVLFDRYCRLDFSRCLVGALQGMLASHV